MKTVWDVMTKEEIVVFKLIVEGKSIEEIAATHGFTVEEVAYHRAEISQKFNLPTYAAMVRFAAQKGLMDITDGAIQWREELRGYRHYWPRGLPEY